MWQNIIVALIVILSVIFTVRKFYRSVRQTDRCNCSCGCAGEETSSCCAPSNRVVLLQDKQKDFEK